MRNKFWMTVEILTLIVWIVVLVVFLANIRTKGTECIANPLVYGSKVLEEKNPEASFNCQCKFSNEPDFTVHAGSWGWEVRADNQDINVNSDKFIVPNISFSRD